MFNAAWIKAKCRIAQTRLLNLNSPDVLLLHRCSSVHVLMQPHCSPQIVARYANPDLLVHSAHTFRCPRSNVHIYAFGIYHCTHMLELVLMERARIISSQMKSFARAQMCLNTYMLCYMYIYFVVILRGWNKCARFFNGCSRPYERRRDRWQVATFIRRSQTT